MNLEKAIEILDKEYKDHHSFRTDIIGQAEQLGIEALKYVKAARKLGAHHAPVLLEGETKD